MLGRIWTFSIFGEFRPPFTIVYLQRGINQNVSDMVGCIKDWSAPSTYFRFFLVVVGRPEVGFSRTKWNKFLVLY